MGDLSQGPDHSEFVEVDPTGRYGRYNEILGKGASKTVYRAFDEYEGIEVAWNQVKLYDFLQSPEELERLYCEIHLLKTLKHKNIMKFYTSWVDTSKRNINFVTEMFTSGTLRQYRQKHKRVNIRAVKHWCRQILSGLLYLHSLDPPVIHRDLKCDNIFINGNQGQVKIGDLGLAAILRKSHAAHCVGTPEFMAPEIYEEQYNELVDIYSFGMCILEMVTFEYPYSECTHPAQIYKKVISGMKPDALYKVQDPDVRQFVEKCLATASRRLPAKELLKDPFLHIDDYCPTPRDDVVDCVPNSTLTLLKQPSFSSHASNGFLMANGFSDDLHDIENGWEYDIFGDETTHGIDLFNSHEDEPLRNVDITSKGKRKDDGSIILKLRIAEKEGRFRNIYFPFDIEVDTALSVATEMIAELDITDYDVTNIAEMIDGEIASLVPEWRPGPGYEDTHGFSTPAICHRCASTVSSYGSLNDYLPLNNPSGSNQPGYQCLRNGCMHGRFEEVTYEAEESKERLTEGALMLSSHSEGVDMSLQASRGNYVDLDGNKMDSSSRDEKMSHVNYHGKSSTRKTMSHLCCGPINEQCVEVSEVGYQHPPMNLPDDYENEIQQELRWLKAKYQMELREYRNQQVGSTRQPLCPSSSFNNREQIAINGVTGSPLLTALHACNNEMFKSLSLGKEFSSHLSHDNSESSRPNSIALADNSGEQSCPNAETRRVRNCEASAQSSPECMFTAKSFYTGVLLPSSIPRTKSLPVDAVDT